MGCRCCQPHGGYRQCSGSHQAHGAREASEDQGAHTARTSWQGRNGRQGLLHARGAQSTPQVPHAPRLGCCLRPEGPAHNDPLSHARRLRECVARRYGDIISLSAEVVDTDGSSSAPAAELLKKASKIHNRTRSWSAQCNGTMSLGTVLPSPCTTATETEQDSCCRKRTHR